MKFVKHQAKFVEAVQVGFFYQEVESHSTLFAPKVTKNFPCSMKDTGDTVKEAFEAQHVEKIFSAVDSATKLP